MSLLAGSQSTMAQTSGVVSKTYSGRAKLMLGPFGRRYYTIVYAIEAPNVERFKFGRTMDMEKRFRSLCNSSPCELRLVGHLWLPDDAEADIHTYLADDRLHGEWFRCSERTRSVAALIGAGDIQALAEEVGMLWMIPKHS